MLSKSIHLILLIILVCSGLTFSEQTSKPQDAHPNSESELELNERIAFLWLLGATAVPMVAGSYIMKTGAAGFVDLGGLIFIGGLLAGPSAGQFYAGVGSHGASGFGLRLAGITMAVVGLWMHSDFECQDCSRSPKGMEFTVTSLMVLGAVTYAVGNLYSLIDTHYAVKKHNEKISARRLGILPILKISSDGQFAGGGSVRLNF